MNVDSSVNISNGHVNTVVSAGNTSVSADVDVNNRNVQSDVQQRNSHVDAQAQVRSGNFHTEVNPHMSVVNDHAQLQNLDYDNAGHIGFQRELIPDESITIDEEGHIHANGESYTAGYGIDITDGVISTTLQREHKSYYNTSTYTMYEGIAPYGSLATDAVWTITTIVSNDVGSIVSVNTATNQVWNYN